MNNEKKITVKILMMLKVICSYYPTYSTFLGLTDYIMNKSQGIFFEIDFSFFFCLFLNSKERKKSNNVNAFICMILLMFGAHEGMKFWMRK